MTDPEDVDARFAALVAGAALDRTITPPAHPAPPSGAQVLTLRVILDDSDPLIWREIELRSDLTLDIVHEVLQVAFAWTDSHLHRFSSGGHPFDDDSVKFLTPFDLEEGDDDGVPERRVRAGEVLATPGAELHYLYDYGDMWAVTLTLAAVRPAMDRDPAVCVTDGERAAPPDDSGGAVDGESLAQLVPDPTAFDPGPVNAALGGELFALLLAGIDSRLIDLVDRLFETGAGHRLAWRLTDLLVDRPSATAEERTAALAPYRWFLERTAEPGLELTAAGYLKPAVLAEAAAVVPSMSTWMWGIHREADVHPIRRFREELQRIGLIRRHRGRLVRTKKGTAALADQDRLWAAVVQSVSARDLEGFDAEATLLILLHAATTPGAPIDGDEIAATLTALGWRHPDGRHVPQAHLVTSPAVLPMSVLREFGEAASPGTSKVVLGATARAIARDALRER